MSLSAMEAARQRKQGLEIFAGIGAKRLKDFLDPAKVAAATATAVAAAIAAPAAPVAAAAGLGPVMAPRPALALGVSPAVVKKPPPDPFDSMMRAGYAVKPRQGVPPQLKKRKY